MDSRGALKCSRSKLAADDSSFGSRANAACNYEHVLTTCKKGNLQMTTTIIDTVARRLRQAEGVQIYHEPPSMQAVDGRFADAATSGLSESLVAYVNSVYPRGLYTHQHRAIRQMLRGEHTVVATRTSSGKSLVYSLPVLDALCHDDDSTALFLYPQKALANDQLLKLKEAISVIPDLAPLAERSPYLASRYDGATEKGIRADVRKDVQLLLTNPDMLHMSMLQWHSSHWGRFFSQLKYVIVDECHAYRGIFGTNVAYILRRLRQLCAMYGSSPTFVATSATISQPEQHLERLTGLKFGCIGPDEDGSQQGLRKTWMIGGNDHFYDVGRKLAVKLADDGLTVLAFCQSRAAAERLTSQTSLPDAPNAVRVYRAGLDAKEREEIEQGLRTKAVKIVYATSALELGIDVGAIDVVICLGLPPNAMSLLQRAGRAARAGKEGAVVVIPANTPADAYFASKPEEYFSRNQESLVLDLTNRRVVHQHYACAAHENGGDECSLSMEVFGEAFEEVRKSRAAGLLDGVDIFYNSEPHGEVNIRSMLPGNFVLQLDGRKIGEIDGYHLLREAYRNAVYRHGGRAYRVQGVSSHKVTLRREYSGHDTQAYIHKQIREKRRFSIAEYSQVVLATVALDAKEFILHVLEKDRSGRVIKNWPKPGGMPEYRLPTYGTVLSIDHDYWACLTEELSAPVCRSALDSCARLLCSLFPVVSGPCDANDISASSQVIDRGGAAIYLYDLVYDGAELAMRAFDCMEDLVNKSLEQVNHCCCVGDEGCVRCVADPGAEGATSKEGTRRVLEAASKVMLAESPEVRRNELRAAERLAGESSIVCPGCQTQQRHGARFCDECGERIGVQNNGN